MRISDEAIEAAAKALRKKFNGYEVEQPWDSRDQRTTYRNDAAAALEAAAPYMLAECEAEALEDAAAVFPSYGPDRVPANAESWLRERAALIRKGIHP